MSRKDNRKAVDSQLRFHSSDIRSITKLLDVPGKNFQNLVLLAIDQVSNKNVLVIVTGKNI